MARKKFNIPEDYIVYLKFGATRNHQEEKDLLCAFKKVKLKKKKIIMSQTLMLRNKVSFSQFPFKRLKFEITKRLLQIDNIIVNGKR